MDKKNMVHGYHGKILRVYLTKGEIITESLDESTLRKYVGGATLEIWPKSGIFEAELVYSGKRVKDRQIC